MKALTILQGAILASAVATMPAAWAQAPATTTPAAAPAAAPAANLERRGQRLFLQCQACHSLTKEQDGKIGPPLNGVVGRKAASAPGFAGYTKSLQGAGLTWDEATLDRWLTQPSALGPGTAMVFVGLPKPEDRQAIVAYLKKATATP
jgi:cytochrome c